MASIIILTVVLSVTGTLGLSLALFWFARAGRFGSPSGLLRAAAQEKTEIAQRLAGVAVNCRLRGDTALAEIWENLSDLNRRESHELTLASVLLKMGGRS